MILEYEFKITYDAVDIADDFLLKLNIFPFSVFGNMNIDDRDFSSYSALTSAEWRTHMLQSRRYFKQPP